jgi:hypothetical protein
MSLFVSAGRDSGVGMNHSDVHMVMDGPREIKEGMSKVPRRNAVEQDDGGDCLSARKLNSIKLLQMC